MASIAPIYPREVFTVAEPAQRRQGRPDQQGVEALDRRLIETAARLFTEQGFAATSIDQVAAAAGVGKQTIYRRYPSKAQLFKAVLSEHMMKGVVDAWERRLEDLAQRAKDETSSPLDALKMICRSALDFILEPDMISLHRVLIAEEQRFPISQCDLERGALVFEGVVSRELKAAEQAGEIPSYHGRYTEQALIGMVMGWASKKTLLGGQVVAASERDEFFECAWGLFLNGVKGGRP
jgi:AcrR family transcriptional regulator